MSNYLIKHRRICFIKDICSLAIEFLALTWIKAACATKKMASNNQLYATRNYSCVELISWQPVLSVCLPFKI
jgi:hypothetical protein